MILNRLSMNIELLSKIKNSILFYGGGGIFMSTGFSNIRTSEYTIINDLYNKIHNKCSFFYPFYFYKKRDDTNISMLNEISEFAHHSLLCAQAKN